MVKKALALGFVLIAAAILVIVVTNNMPTPEPKRQVSELDQGDPLLTIKTFAEELCGSFASGGSDQSVAFQGDAEAKLKGVLEKLTDLGVKGTTNFDSKKYVGVLREELGKELQSVRDCRLTVWQDLKVSVISGQQSVSVNQSSSQSLSIVSTGWVETDDLSQYSKSELRVMRNELYAKYGYRFKSADLREYFSAQPWYKPNTDDATVAYKRMTAMERSNVLLIKEEEARR
jgi:hypothetical protein